MAILKTALLSGQPEPPAVGPGIDRAIREYARTHGMEEPAVASAEDRRPLEQFLGYIQEVAKTERSTYQREIKLVRSEEQWYFRFSALAIQAALSIPDPQERSRAMANVATSLLGRVPAAPPSAPPRTNLKVASAAG